MINSREIKKVSDVFRRLFNGYCPSDDSLLEKLRTWLEASLNDAGSMFHVISLNDEELTYCLDGVQTLLTQDTSDPRHFGPSNLRT